MADLFPVAGARFYIGGVKETQAEDFQPTDFADIAETDWVEVDGWETAGGLGDAAQEITTQLINRKRDLRQKGTRNAGTMENQFAIIPGDAGQVAMRAAEKSSDNFAFRVVYDDGSPDGQGTTQYFVGLVMSWSDANGGANTTRMKSATIGVNSNIAHSDAS